MSINDLTLGQIKELQKVREELTLNVLKTQKGSGTHPMLGRRCICRTYSAGVHVGDIVYINPENSMEVKLENALRIWKWEGGGLSLSSVAKNGIKGGRLNETGEIYLTNVIEMIPTTKKAEETYNEFVEDKE